MTSVLAWALAYLRAFRARVASDGLVAVAPASLAFLLVTLAVSALWREPGAGHRAVAACCAWRATTLTHGAAGLGPLFGSAFLVRRPVEAVWTVAATWLVLGPLEAAIGSRRLLLLGAFGHAVPTVLVDLYWLAGGRAGGGLEGIDVGTSAVVVTAAAALAVLTRSPPLGLALAAGLAVDLGTTPNLASVEHLVAVVIGAGGALLLLCSNGRWALAAPRAGLPRRAFLASGAFVAPWSSRRAAPAHLPTPELARPQASAPSHRYRRHA